jgi:hypothetical protein
MTRIDALVTLLWIVRVAIGWDEHHFHRDTRMRYDETAFVTQLSRARRSPLFISCGWPQAMVRL